MTHDHFDELASAHLDGTTTPQEGVEAAASPTIQRRAEELRAVRAAIQAAPPVDPGRREEAIAAALAAFAEPVAPPVAPVTSLASVRAGRPRPPRGLTVIGAAAAVILLALLVPLLGRLGSTDRRETAATKDAAVSTTSAAPASGADAGGAPPTTIARPLAPLDLGTFDTFAGLAAAAATSGNLHPDASAAPSSGQGLALDCSAAVDKAADTTVLARAVATVASVPVLAITTRDGAGHLTLRVYRSSDCALLTEQTLPSG